jgi:aspartyl-tRNA(Asn)/glutamyl-tRNA(Gln) amidotransferase subunit C
LHSALSLFPCGGDQLMTIDRTAVASVATLARIGVTGGELDSLVQRIDRVLDLVAAMQAVDTAGVEPMHHPLDAVQRLRPDLITEADVREDLQALAPAAAAGLYLVPRVIE